MARKLTASDRKSLIRMASSLPKGSPERKAILAGLKKVGEYEGIHWEYHNHYPGLEWGYDWEFTKDPLLQNLPRKGQKIIGRSWTATEVDSAKVGKLRALMKKDLFRKVGVEKFNYDGTNMSFEYYSNDMQYQGDTDAVLAVSEGKKAIFITNKDSAFWADQWQ